MPEIPGGRRMQSITNWLNPWLLIRKWYVIDDGLRLNDRRIRSLFQVVGYMKRSMVLTPRQNP